MAIAKKGRKNVSLHSCPVAIIYYKFFSLLYDGFRDFLLQIGNQHRHTSQKYTINGYLIIKMSHSFFSRDSIVITLQVVVAYQFVIKGRMCVCILQQQQKTDLYNLD